MTQPDDKTFALAELVRRAMTTSYSMHAREAATSFETGATLEAIVQLLIDKGLIARDEFMTARDAAAERIAGHQQRSWVGPWLTVIDETQEAKPAKLVDCETRHPTCQAACCTFYKVILTEGEVRGGALLWDLGAPYSLPRGPSGHCAYLDRESLKCTVWQDRPFVCRGYSCESDREIWADFEKVIPTERVRAMSRKR